MYKIGTALTNFHSLICERLKDIMDNNSRKFSENCEKIYVVPAVPTMHHMSNLEKNCNQIFVKGPQLTRSILGKMKKADFGPNTTSIFGYQLKMKQFWVLAGLILLLLLSLTGTIVMWFTSIFDNAIFSNLVLAKNSEVLEMWQRPAPKPLLKIYLFNYTNIAEYEDGTDEKLNVKEIGPYVYEETLERVNVQFNGSSVSYQEHRDYKFIPEASIGCKQSDRVIVPNVPLFAAAAKNKHSNFFARLALSGMLNSLNAKPFLSLPAHKFIVGYEDNLYSVIRSVLKLQNQKPYENFGLLAGKIGLQPDKMTINTGIRDINKLGLVEKFNEQSELGHWSTKECNSLMETTDGSMFPPKLIRDKRPVHFFFKEMCRAMPLEYESEVKILNNKIPAFRYSMPDNVFDSPEKTPKNQCFCDMNSGECPPQGVFNATACAFGAPAFISLPHFYKGDANLRKSITGLSENPKYYKTYVDLHPTMGFVMSGRTRFQFNVRVAKSFGISQMDMFEDNLMLPVVWFELSLEDKTLPDDMVSIIFQTTFTIKSLEISLKYGCLLTSLVTIVFLLIVVGYKWPKRERTSSIRPLQRHNEDLL